MAIKTLVLWYKLYENTKILGVCSEEEKLTTLGELKLGYCHVLGGQFELSFFALKSRVLACSFAYCKPCVFKNKMFSL